ncbi:MAG: thiamine-binding protein [Planctomycetota bacterium]
MISTAEISMYPFQENYKALIKEFIGKLQAYSDLRVTPGSTATVIVGDYDRLMECVTEMMRWSHEKQGRAVFIVKFLPGYAAH